MLCSIQRDAAGNEEVRNWHVDPRRNPEELRIMWAIRGESTEFAEDETGRGATTIAPQSLAILKPETSRTKGAVHREPQNTFGRIAVRIELIPC
jgi:hypothetical protein